MLGLQKSGRIVESGMIANAARFWGRQDLGRRGPWESIIRDVSLQWEVGVPQFLSLPPPCQPADQQAGILHPNIPQMQSNDDIWK